MKIGFDAKRAVQNNTGLGNYSRYVIEILSDFFFANHYVLFAPRRKENSRLKNILSKTNISFVFPAGIAGLLSVFWRIGGIKKNIRQNGVEIFHGLSNELPFGIRNAGVKSVVTIHDLIFVRYPEYYNLFDRIIYRFKSRYACRMANKIIAVSECTKRDVVALFHVPEEKIEVVYQGCHPVFGQKATDEKKTAVREKYRLPALFILNVGSVEPRKNLLLALKTLKHLPDDVHLVAAGKPTAYQTKVEQYAQKNRLRSRLHLLNDVAFEDLPALYQLAAVFVYPSFFEGFGIPVIEALHCGLPVVAATGSCLEEAGGPDSMYVDPEDDVLLASRIAKILSDKELAKRMSEKGKVYVKRFSKENVAENLMKVYKSL
ncbi:MAG: glycosyltransferase family 4 protein [Tannerella sp.]|jgi:glycosyltransferase involved in cell wall biosynthesis|nr:glycosyltransferase family 4 protein [Tannerella sp.]